jgi:hypothetical protein
MFIVAYPQKLMLHIKPQPQKSKDRNVSMSLWALFAFRHRKLKLMREKYYVIGTETRKIPMKIKYSRADI